MCYGTECKFELATKHFECVWKEKSKEKMRNCPSANKSTPTFQIQVNLSNADFKLPKSNKCYFLFYVKYVTYKI